LRSAGIKERIINLLKEHEEEALFSKALATIRRDAPIAFALPEKPWRDCFDPNIAEPIFQEFEFKSLHVRLKSVLGDKSLVANTEIAAESKEETVDPTEVRKVGIALWLINSDLASPTLEDIYAFAKTRSFAEARETILRALEERGLKNVYLDIELPLIPLITRAQERGILIDVPYLESLSQDYHAKLSAFEKKIYELAGEEFNINSPKQLGDILFDKLELKTKGLKKTAGGARSTRESELEKLRDLHPIIEQILSYRELQKLLSTYIDTIPKMVGSDGRLHTTLDQTGTTTGRMSSSNPNLQNIPAREGLGSAVRKAFVAAPGHVLLALDYSQIEMRILAELSGDEGLVEIFQTGKDVHGSVASRVFGVPEGEVTKDMRRQAKVINFGIVYGMGVTALRQNLGSTREEAQEFYDNYFKTFPGISKYFDRVKQQAHECGYTETLFGRRRYFPGLASKLPYVRAMAERMAMNAPIQGTATGDLVKLAMIKADQALKAAGLDNKAFLLLQVHDELIYEIEESSADQAAGLIKNAMENAHAGRVPLAVNVSRGASWGTLTQQ